MMSLSLIVTKSVCSGNAEVGNDVNLPSQVLVSAAKSLGKILGDEAEQPLLESLNYFCSESPFSYIGPGFYLPRRILTFMVLLSTGQFVIVTMNQFPNWAKEVRFDTPRNRSVACITRIRPDLGLISASVASLLAATIEEEGPFGLRHHDHGHGHLDSRLCLQRRIPPAHERRLLEIAGGGRRPAPF